MKPQLLKTEELEDNKKIAQVIQNMFNSIKIIFGD